MKQRFSGELLKPIEIRTHSYSILLNSPTHRQEVDAHNKQEFENAFLK